MHARFYAPGAGQPGERVALPPEEARHLTQVLRLGPGDAVRVFNGRGGEFEAVIARAARSAVTVEIRAPRQAAPEPRVAVTLAQAVLKGDRMDAVVRDGVMMGVAAIQPLVTSRAEVTLATLERARRQQRWERIAVSSAKQCGRAVVPPILAPCAFHAMAPAFDARSRAALGLMLVEPGAGAGAQALHDADLEAPDTATIAIGPEGGWTGAEMERGAAVFRLVTLGGRTLRAETMPLVALSALFALWKEL